MIVDTICRDCVFAEFESDVQVGCDLDRLEKLGANGAVLVEEEADGLTYARIKGRNCTACRNHEWADKKRSEGCVDLFELEDAAYEEYKLKPLAVIYAGPDSTDDQVRDSIASLKVQEPPIAHLTLCFYQEYGRAASWVAEFASDGPGCTWSVVQGEDPTDEMLASYGPDPYLRLVDEAVLKTRLGFYTAARAGFEWHRDFVYAVHEAVEVDMKRIVGVLPAPDRPGEGFLSQVYFHRHFAAENRGAPIYEKFGEFAAEFGGLHTIVSYEDLGLEDPR